MSQLQNKAFTLGTILLQLHTKLTSRSFKFRQFAFVFKSAINNDLTENSFRGSPVQIKHSPSSTTSPLPHHTHFHPLHVTYNLLLPPPPPTFSKRFDDGLSGRNYYSLRAWSGQSLCTAVMDLWAHDGQIQLNRSVLKGNNNEKGCCWGREKSFDIRFWVNATGVVIFSPFWGLRN